MNSCGARTQGTTVSKSTISHPFSAQFPPFLNAATKRYSLHTQAALNALNTAWKHTCDNAEGRMPPCTQELPAFLRPGGSDCGRLRALRPAFGGIGLRGADFSAEAPETGFRRMIVTLQPRQRADTANTRR